jgi:pimeloyl-ACP methyl ester carboxylesterase
VKVNGKELAVEIDGPRTRPRCCWCTAWAARRTSTRSQTDALAERLRWSGSTRPGAGRSPVADGISITAHADDLAAVLDALGSPRPAWSGTRWARWSCGSCRNRTRTGVTRWPCSAPSREPAEAGRQAQRDRAALLRGRAPPRWRPASCANALSETTAADRPEVAAFVRELVMRQDPEGYARNCEALAAATDPGPVAADCRCC